MKGEIIPIIIGMGIVTYIPRWLPLFFLSRRRLPPWLIDWLDFIPAAILSALISAVARHDEVNHGTFCGSNRISLGGNSDADFRIKNKIPRRHGRHRNGP